MAAEAARVSRGLLLLDPLETHSNAAPAVAAEFEAARARPSRGVMCTASEAAGEVGISRCGTAFTRAEHAAEPRHA